MSGERILAISPSTKEIGVAVLAGQDLLYYGVKTISRRGPTQTLLEEAARIIRRLLADYQPMLLALEQRIIIQSSGQRLALIISEMKRIASAEGLTLYEQSAKAARQFICGGGKATKQEVAQRIAVRYPELARYLDRRSHWEEQYYARMFTAVAVGLLCYQDLHRQPIAE